MQPAQRLTTSATGISSVKTGCAAQVSRPTYGDRHDAPTRRAHRAPVAVRRPDPRAWGHALQLAAGDHRRLEVLIDGTVVVHNRQAR